MTSVRNGTDRDLERVVAIKVRTWSDTYGPLIAPEVLRPFLDQAAQLAYLREKTRSANTILLVAEDHGVVGFALTFLDHGPDPWLESLHVHPDSQSRGVGTLLMRVTASELKARGRNSMGLGVVEGNTAAERFYERLGAVDAGREPTSWAEGVMHHLYRWPTLEGLT
ncbi:MAG TPA: GNAT family N-acetyltransferase [Candidatus Dormibacteraeota bacterium]|nr:GNAT family N-acetyltransferase [Candidatus Dormibacteraeota bacterium]